MNKSDARERVNTSLDEIEKLFMKLANSNPQLSLSDFELVVSCFGQHLASARKLTNQHLRD